ncbi:hypothetical protein D3C78_1970830 [compost metagenome]
MHRVQVEAVEHAGHPYVEAMQGHIFEQVHQLPLPLDQMQAHRFGALLSIHRQLQRLLRNQ